MSVAQSRGKKSGNGEGKMERTGLEPETSHTKGTPTTTAALQRLWYFDDSLFHIRTHGASGPRDNTRLVELLHRDHVAHSNLVSPNIFLIYT
jgi:hypothetical protein